jgi:signal transduction histidine kinase
MRRLYKQFYLTIIASLLLLVAAATLMWKLAAPDLRGGEVFEVAAEIAGAVLPAADAPAAEQRQVLEHFGRKLRADLALYGADLTPIASTGRSLPAPSPGRLDSGTIFGKGGPAYALLLPDGRWLVARTPVGRGRPVVGIVLFLGGLALAVALGAYPVVRRLTGRLERLQTGVESLGAGDLSARVKVEGKDEVASLAASFNRAADRIEQLVAANKLLLANASHELRTPLSRLRMSIELLSKGSDVGRKAEIEQDIAELDDLITEILLASRLDAVSKLERSEEVDLLGLAAEEAAHYDACDVSGDAIVVVGDDRLLRRLIRNLIENAHRHGTPPVAVSVGRAGGSAVLRVSDHGPGIPEADRERIFEPFFRTGRASSSGSRSSTGTGLGLALVRQIARQHGGDATYSAEAGGRSVFTVTLPLAG